MQVLPQCGHAVHEDVPDKVAEVLATFMIRHKFAEPESNFERFVCSDLVWTYWCV
jgi:protein phosphatase methylesterase 1